MIGSELGTSPSDRYNTQGDEHAVQLSINAPDLDTATSKMELPLEPRGDAARNDHERTIDTMHEG